ncbi:MAG: STAS/SEC14 domain-containing protein [Vulcanococcus sp.]
MIELMHDLPDGTVGFCCRGQLSGDDIQQQVLPAIEQAMTEHEQIKCLVVFEPGFEGFSLEAAWEDANLGLRHWNGFERMAVVVDPGWLQNGLRAIGLLMPCPMKLFSSAEMETAQRWLSEDLGTIHLDLQGEILSVSLIGQVDRKVYERINDDLANLFSRVEQPRVLLDLRQFEGWQGLQSLNQHLALLREYRHRPSRVAVVYAKPWQQLAQRMMAQFVSAKTRTFSGDDLLAAQEWICAE